jgi:hypothetical protein
VSDRKGLERWADRSGNPVFLHIDGEGCWYCPRCHVWKITGDFIGVFRARGSTCSACRVMQRRGTGRIGINLRLRFLVLSRDLFTCQYCGRSAPAVKLHVDHILAVVRGGTNDPNNLITACVECNIGKHDALF